MALRTSISHEERDGLLNHDDNEIELQDFPAANWNNLQDFAVTNWKRAALSLMNSVRPHLQWRFSITRLAWFLVPSFLQGEDMLKQIRPAKLSPTSYLDGMRGVASFIVFFHHLALPCYNWERAWGAEDNYDLILFPFIRLVHAGPAAVSLFFVISGYSLSYRPIKHIRSQNVTDLSTGISSMAFRRVIRLFLPVIFSTGMTFCLIRIGAFDWSRSIATNKTYFRNRFEYHPKRLPSIYDQFVEWASVIIGGFQIFDWALYRGFVIYDTHLWTIPVELRCSFVLFILTMATSHLQTKYRLLTVTGVLCYSHINNRWDMQTFLAGMLLVEWDHIREAHIPPPASPQGRTIAKPAQSKLQTIFWHLASILGLYFLSHHSLGDRASLGWAFISSLTPKHSRGIEFRYWKSIGGICFVFAVGHSRWWQRVFNSHIAQYLGKISYALYLMHGPILKVIGYYFQDWAWGITGVEGRAYNAGFLLGACFCIPTVVWAADIFWRAVDIPTVKFARWYEGKLIVKD
ncbi:acyltransferase family-domain-containing protein [Ilyonectria destructans]|nr:acyltransferase family-domain-containing protein [Ilyonectria destructans]